MAEPLRVLMTADTLGGVWQYTVELARALSAHEVEIALATLGAPLSQTQRGEIDALGNVELFESDYRLCWMDDAWNDVEASSGWLLDIAARVRPDVVHLNDLGHGALPWPAPVLLVGHSCVLSWWRAVHGCDAPETFARYRRHVTASVRAADLVVAPSDAMLAALGDHYGPLPRARTIANGRRPQDWPANTKEPVVFAAGRIWDEAKNLAALAAVAPRLSWPVCIAGDARSPDGRAIDLPAVQRPGVLSRAELADRLAAASIYALPARYEPFGLSVLEAALAGCALVLGDIPSLRGIWVDAALYVDPDDHEALASTLQRLIDAPDLRADLAARARRRALRYAPSRMAQDYLDAYRELARPRPAPVRTHAIAMPSEAALTP